MYNDSRALACLTRLICERRVTRLIDNVSGPDRSITRTREMSARRITRRTREAKTFGRNTTGGGGGGGGERARASDDRSADRPARPLNSTLIWTLRASLPDRFGGPIAPISWPVNLSVSRRAHPWKRDRVARVLFKCRQRNLGDVGPVTY